ncbi:MAG: ribonuclease HII [Anaerolineae bacterium]|nr:ribonuclease HII [Anaerolineae bacterium]
MVLASAHDRCFLDETQLAGTRAELSFETDLWRAGYQHVAGVDEVGRGAWAGPVVAAAVILPADTQAVAPLVGAVDDSKKLTPRTRARLFDLIHTHAEAIGVGSASAEEIDAVGIAQANRLALARAIGHLSVQPDFVLLDFFTLPQLRFPQRGVPHGDELSLTIASASIIAKVTRDRWMAEQDDSHPGYDFARHKGYGTAMHSAALTALGPCVLHRRSFAPVASCVHPDQIVTLTSGSEAVDG